MLYNLEQFTREYMAFNAAELFTLARLFKPISFDENDFVIEKSQNVSNIYFLDRGVLKSYIENNGRMYDVKFYFNPIFFSDLNGLINRKELIKKIVIVKKSNLFVANFEDIKKLNEKSEKHKLFFKMILEEDYMFDSSFIV